MPKPEFNVNPGDVMIKFAAPVDMAVHGPGKVTDGVTDAERRILNELKTDPGYSYVIIAKNIGIRKKCFRAYKKKKEKGIIERVGNIKTGHWKIRL